MKLYQLDSFTQEVFKGNPAAVCIVEDDLDEGLMQKIATEMNLSETAFVKVYDAHCNLRWFTPAREVPLCGHATLATASVLWEHGYWPKEKQIEFNTLSGSLFTSYEQGLITMDFPAKLPESNPNVYLPEIEEEFGCSIVEVLSVPNELMLIMKSEEELRNLKPDPGFIARLAKNGVMVSALSDGAPYDFVSRYFAPNLGIYEDPVTGFMHTILTPYWAQKTSKSSFYAYQASARGGQMHTELKGDRVLLKGYAVEVLETTIRV